MNLHRRSVMAGAVGAAVATVTTPWFRPEAALRETRPATVLFDDADGAVVVATPASFPGIDPTGTADSTAGLQAALDACADGGLVIVPTGRYKVSSALAPKNGASIRLQGYGATLVGTSDKAIFSLRGAYDNAVKVLRVETVSRQFDTGASELTAVVTLSSAQDWRPGDTVKIVSDDPIDGARSSRNRRGEFATVFGVSGAVVTLSGRLREVYTQNVRIARIGRQTISIEGFSLETASDMLLARGDAIVSLSRLQRPIVRNVSIVRAGGHALRFSSCYGYLVDAVNVLYAQDSPNESILGYGILDNACSFGEVRGGIYQHVRHAYTDDTPAIDAGAEDLGGYGRTYGTVVAGVHAFGTTAAGFSTHHAAEGVVFDSCRSTSGVPNGSSAVGFELRGKAHHVVNCTAVNLTNGVLIRTESGGGESWGHRIAGFHASRMTNAAVRFEIHPSGHPLAGQRETKHNAVIDGLTAEGCLRLIFSESAKFSLDGAYYLAPEGSDDALIEGLFLRNSDTTLRDVVLDYSQNVAGRPRPIIAGGSSGLRPGGQLTRIDGLDVRIEPAAAARGYFVFGGAENVILGRRITLSNAFPRVPGESHPQSSLEWEVLGLPSGSNTDLSSRYHALKSTALPAQLGEILKSADPEVWIHVNTEGKKLTISELPAGRRRGQRWVFFQSSAGELTFVHGAAARTSLKSSANRTLWRGRRLELVWDGQVWHEPAAL